MPNGIVGWPAQGSSGTGAVTSLGTATVAGSAATSMTISGLDLSAYQAFKVFCKLKNATASAAGITFYYSGDTTDTNYRRVNMNVDSGGFSYATSNDGRVGIVTGNQLANIEVTLAHDVDNEVRSFSHITEMTGASIRIRQFATLWETGGNVTSIQLSSAVASALAVGSTFTVYGIS